MVKPVWEYLNGLNIQIFRNASFSTFQNITREKPALYLSLLKPAEPNDLHMIGIVGDDSILIMLRNGTSVVGSTFQDRGWIW